jgi:hypothetical protein
VLYPLNRVSAEGRSQVLWKDGEGVFCRGWPLEMKVKSNLTKEGAIVRAYVRA